jgi:hypothetical protein
MKALTQGQLLAVRIGLILFILSAGALLDRLVNPREPCKPERVIAVVFDMDTMFIEAPDVDSLELEIDTTTVTIWTKPWPGDDMIDYMEPPTHYGDFKWRYVCPCGEYGQYWKPTPGTSCCPVCGNSDVADWEYVVSRYKVKADGYTKLSFHRKDSQ